MFYDKQIKYLDVYENGEKVQNAGFVRLEAREDKVTIQLRAEKLRQADTCKVQVMMTSEDTEAVLGEIVLEKGMGALLCPNLKLQDMAGGIGYQELCEIYLRLSGKRVLRCIVRERKPAEEESEAVSAAMITENEVESEAFVLQVPMPEPGSISEEMPPMAPLPEYIPEAVEEYEEEIPVMEPVPILEPEPMQMPEPRSESEPQFMPRAQQIPRSMSEPGPVLRPMSTAPMRERQSAATKWQQLSNLYPHIRPFGDGRDYLQVKPEDFVILKKEYYPLVSNSFLKHGYYNYEHLILTREMRQDGEHFYIGVPGNFYEKEKQVAVLFGFESFEGKSEPAKNGDFGYYMITVEI